MTNQTYIDHYLKPRNKGKMFFSSIKVEFTSKGTCLDHIKAYVKFDKSKKIIKKIIYQVEGCSAIIAAMSYMSEKVTGMSKDDAREDVTPESIMKALELSPEKKHAADAAHRVLQKI